MADKPRKPAKPRKPRKPAKPRTPEQNAAIYRRRIERGAAQGLSPSESVGKRNRNYAAENAQRVAREVAQGKRKPPKAAPANRKAPTGARLTGSRRYLWPDPAEQAEPGIRRLNSDRRVFLYPKIVTVYPSDLANALDQGDGVDIDEMIELDPWAVYAALLEVGTVEDTQLFPNGGIRAQALRVLMYQQGGLHDVILSEIGNPNRRYRTGSNPAINPANRQERSPILSPTTPTGQPEPLQVYLIGLVVQWQ